MKNDGLSIFLAFFCCIVISCLICPALLCSIGLFLGKKFPNFFVSFLCFPFLYECEVRLDFAVGDRKSVV